jgi:hypothetical protein
MLHLRTSRKRRIAAVCYPGGAMRVQHPALDRRLPRRYRIVRMLCGRGQIHPILTPNLVILPGNNGGRIKQG